MNKEIENKIETLEERIRGLERDLDELCKELDGVRLSRKNIRDIMEEVAKMANQPVGIMFDYSSA